MKERMKDAKLKKLSKFLKRSVKDTVFSDLFSIPKYRRELYLALMPQDKTVREEEIESVTIKNILTNGIVNDFAISVRDTLLILMEAQSSWNENMPYRMFSYLAENLNRYLREHKQVGIYNTKIKIPKLRLYVLYSGDKKIPRKELSFKETYFPDDKDCPVELKIQIITLTTKKNILNEYIMFTRILDKNIKKYGYTEKCIKITIKECLEKNVLTEYLEKKKTEVIKVMLSMFDQETALDDYGMSKYNEGRAEGEIAGEAKGKTEGILYTLLELVKDKILTIKQAAERMGVSEKEFKKLMTA